MLAFLRKIRKSLNESGSTRKYLVYAIGEIALVVIGILIALQINNWNENRKEKIIEHQMLREILSGVEHNIWSFKFSIQGNHNSIASCNIILKHLEADLPYHDSLDIHFGNAISWNIPTLRNDAFESLKSYGINLVKK